MKKLLAVLLFAALIVFSVGACNKAPVQETEQNSSVSPNEETQSPASEQGTTEELIAKAMDENAFDVPAMNEEQQKFYDLYVEQLLHSSMLLNSWSVTETSALSADPSGAKNGSLLMLAFEDIVGGDEMQKLWKQYDGKFPEETVEDVLSIFPYSTEQLHDILANHYDAAEKVYNYEGGRGGGPIECAVTGVKTLDDQSVKVTYAVFTGYDDEATIAGGNKEEMYTSRSDGTLTLKPEADGGYSYLSVLVNAFYGKVTLESTEVDLEA